MPRSSTGNSPGFDKGGVFINCPFDEKYLRLFRAIIFAVHDLGLKARSALEASNAGTVRIDKIQDIIGSCKFSIHDLSRTQVDRIYRLPRFNMPLELGIDLGCKRFGTELQKTKVILILDVERFRYQRFISDIAGQDVYSHGGTQREAIVQVREWLRPELNPEKATIPGGKEILQRFRSFQRELPSICRRLKWNLSTLGFADYVYATTNWISDNPV
jgi:hypothetical protein